MIVTAGQVRRKTETVLRAGLPLLLEGLSEQEGIPLPLPRSWEALVDFTKIAERQSPAVVVTTPGPAEPPVRNHRGLWAPWDVQVYVVVRGRTYEETADRVGAYTAAVRAVLLGAPTLGGLASGCKLREERYVELDADQARTVGRGSVTVRFSQIDMAGTPDRTLPIPAGPTVLTTETVVTVLPHAPRRSS